MFCSPIKMLPELVDIKLTSSLANVDLPEPLTPTRAIFSPKGILIEKWCNMFFDNHIDS